MSRDTAHIVVMTASGATIRKAGHAGRLRSCSMENNTVIPKGTNVMKSNVAPTKVACKASSDEGRYNSGKYHTWLSVMLAKKAADHRRNRTGDVTSGAMALLRRSSR